jgi:hypothetical protein
MPREATDRPEYPNPSGQAVTVLSMVTIRSELRRDEAELEVWAHLGDVLDWLDSVPEQTSNRIAADVALEIREMLFDAVKSVEFVERRAC